MALVTTRHHNGAVPTVTFYINYMYFLFLLPLIRYIREDTLIVLYLFKIISESCTYIQVSVFM